MVDDVQIVGKTLLDLLLKQCLGTKLGKWFMQKHQTSPCFSVVETRAHQSTSTPKALCRTTFRWQKWPFTKDIMKQKHTLKTNKQILVGSFNPGMFKKCWKIPRRFSCKTPKQKSQSHQDPSAQAHGKAIQSSFTLRERWTQVTYFWTFFLSCCLFWRFQFFDKRLQVGCSCQRRCLSSTLIRSWVFEGYQRDKRVDQVEWSVVKSILSRYFQPNSDSKRRQSVYDNPLERWYGGMVIWPKLNVPCCIALNFRTNFAGRQRRKTYDRSDGFECEWGWVMWRKSMTRVEKRTI